MKRILHISIALLLLAVAGQNAWAETKTVTYTLSRVKVEDRNYWALTHSGSTPFNGQTTVANQLEDNATQATFQLPDGFVFTFNWKGGTVTHVNSDDFFCSAKPQFKLEWNFTSRYVTQVRVTANDGTVTALDGGGSASTDKVCLERGPVSYTAAGNAYFAKLVITYTDVPNLNIFTQLGGKIYEIKSKDDLRHLAEFVNNGGDYNTSGLTFRQTQDITFTYTTAWDAPSSKENNYTAIGTTNKDFWGDYDGQGHTISGIRIYKPEDPNQGLFGKIFNGAVRGVRLADARITGNLSVGGIVGNMSSSTVEDCVVTDDVCIHAVQNESNYHGGIVGFSNGTVQRCLSQATLTIANASDCRHYGAIVGGNDKTVKDCIAVDATVPGVSNAGAIIGKNKSGSTVQRNYYRACTVAGTANAIGVGVGRDDNNDSPHDITTNQGTQALYSLTLPSDVTLERTASATLPGTGNKTYTTGADIDGMPFAFSGATVTLSYSGDVPFGKAVVYSATAGTIDGNVLTMPSADVTVSATLVDDLWGEASGADGSAEKPFRISSLAGLNLLATNVNSGVSTYSGKHFLQTANLTYDGTENNFTAIGTSSNPFSGHYDGGKKTISGINISKTGTTDADKYQGIFGYVNGGTIERLALAGSTIAGYQNVGGIVGYLKGTVQNCRVEDNVTISTNDRSSTNIGGVVGISSNDNDSFIQGCVCGATVTGQINVGGIVGDSGGTLRSNFYFGTKVTGDYCGAILGINNFSYNNYYIASANVQFGLGVERNSKKSCDMVSDNSNASRAKLLTLGVGVKIDVPEQNVVNYDFSGLTDLGGKALRYDDGNSVRTFTHTWQTVTFRYDGEVPAGKSVAFHYCATNN